MIIRLFIRNDISLSRDTIAGLIYANLRFIYNGLVVTDGAGLGQCLVWQQEICFISHTNSSHPKGTNSLSIYQNVEVPTNIKILYTCILEYCLPLMLTRVSTIHAFILGTSVYSPYLFGLAHSNPVETTPLA